jgi:hypothetical protein
MSSEFSYPTGTIMQSKELVGPRVVGLAGHNGTFEESLTLSGEGLIKGKRYSQCSSHMHPSQWLTAYPLPLSRWSHLV